VASTQASRSAVAKGRGFSMQRAAVVVPNANDEASLL
jgi:hypothetical protein